jgi:hypothetical protein
MHFGTLLKHAECAMHSEQAALVLDRHEMVVHAFQTVRVFREQRLHLLFTQISVSELVPVQFRGFVAQSCEEI